MENRVRAWRRRRRLSQEQLARAAGVTRQAVSAVETGAASPGVDVALRLAGVLGCRVEDLFGAAPGGEPVAVVLPAGTRDGARVAVATVGGRTVARPVDGLGDARWPAVAAAGVVRDGAASLIELTGPRRPAVFLAGCDPALGLLAAHAAAGAGFDVLWWHAANAAAAAEADGGTVHLAGLHGSAPGAAAAAGDGVAARYRLAAWRMGWITRGDRVGFVGPADLAAAGIRLADREPGSGARELLDRLLRHAGVDPEPVHARSTVCRGHYAAALAVANGRADVALGAEVAAHRLGLAFAPVEEQTCDLILSPAAADDPVVVPVLDTLTSGWFRRDLAAFGPYEIAATGDRVA